MKGIIEEYGTFVAGSIIALLLVSSLILSVVKPDGALHQFIVGNMENVGAESQTVIKQWDIGSIKAILKDDGGLYLTGSGDLPSYGSVGDTPWADYSGKISFVNVENTVVVNGTVPIK